MVPKPGPPEFELPPAMSQTTEHYPAVPGCGDGGDDESECPASSKGQHLLDRHGAVPQHDVPEWTSIRSAIDSNLSLRRGSAESCGSATSFRSSSSRLRST